MNEEKKAEYEEKTRQKWESRGEQKWGLERVGGGVGEDCGGGVWVRE